MTRRNAIVFVIVAILVLGAIHLEANRRTRHSDEGESGRLKPPPSVGQGEKQTGISYPSWSVNDYSLPFTEKSMQAIRDTGAKWVVLIPTWYQRSTSSDDIRRTEQTPSDESLEQAIVRARALGLKVVVKPHVDLDDDSDRAAIRSAHPDRWFSAYSRFITHYAVLAEASGAEEFVVGTELRGTSADTGRWRNMIGQVRERYRGLLTYAANYDEYKQVQFWDALDFIGLNAYWPLSSSSTADVNVLTRSWKPLVDEMARLAARWERPVLFTEAGYTSQHGSTTAPFDWMISTRPDYEEQAAGYEALLRSFWAQSWFAGVHWWMWDDAPSSMEDQALRYTPHGKPAEEVLRHWWHS